MIQYRSALMVSAPPCLHMRFPTSKLLPTLESTRASFGSLDTHTAAAIAMFGRSWIHFSKRPDR